MRLHLIILVVGCLLPHPVFSATNQVTNESLLRAHEALALGNPAIALRAFSRIIAADPKNAEAHAGRGVCRAHLGDLAGAEIDLSQSLRLDPALITSQKERARVRLDLRKWPECIEDCDAILALDPQATSILALRAEAHLRQGERDRARADLDAALKLETGNVTLWLKRAQLRAELGNWLGATVDASRALELQPEHTEALLTRGRGAMKLGMVREAVTDFERVVTRDPKHVEALILRGTARRLQGELQLSLADLDRAVELDARNAAARTERAETRRQLEDFGGEYADLVAALQSDPRHIPALLRQAEILQLAGEYTAQLHKADVVLGIEPDNAHALYLRGAAHMYLDESLIAITHFTRVIELQPSMTNLMLASRGSANLRVDRFGAAIADFDAALAAGLDPSMMLYERGVAFFTSGDHDRARRDFTELIRIRPRGTDAYIAHGLTRRASGEWTLAQVDFDAAAERGDPWGAFWWYIVTSEKGDPAVASAYLREKFNQRLNAIRGKWEHTLGRVLLGETSEDTALQMAPGRGSPGSLLQREAAANLALVVAYRLHLQGDHVAALEKVQRAIQFYHPATMERRILDRDAARWRHAVAQRSLDR